MLIQNNRKVVTLGQRMQETSYTQCGETNGVTLLAPCTSSGLGIPFSASSQNIEAANQNTVLNFGPQIVSSPNFPSSPTTSFWISKLADLDINSRHTSDGYLHHAMATPRRRSARLSRKSSTPEVSPKHWNACYLHFAEDDYLASSSTRSPC